ncbi:MAG: hypothetical protein KDC71_01520 [Acidobacteria bacterium]|nr:hypothetical protein [Acidobacteriota bacterium]
MLVWMALSFLVLGPAGDDGLEPPLQFVLQVDGQNHPIVVGEPSQIKGTFSNPTILLKAASLRHFPYGGVEFDYPANFSWEAEIDGSDRTWTLSGNDFKIIYFVMSEALTLDEYVEAIREQFGDDKIQVTFKERAMGSLTVKGQRLKATLAGIPFFMEVYLLPTQKGTRLLVFQDFPGEGTQSSPEGDKTFKMFSASFKNTL